MNRVPTVRECMAVLYAARHYRQHLRVDNHVGHRMLGTDILAVRSRELSVNVH